MRTIWRWQAHGWPRCAHLALFFASRWGWSAVECDARNTVTMFRGLAQAHEADAHALRAKLAHVQALADTGAANLPVMRA